MSELDSPVFQQVVVLVEDLQQQGYLQCYQEDLYKIDRDVLFETAVPNAEYIYTVRHSGTDLCQIKHHPVSNQWAEAAINAAISGCNHEDARLGRTSQYCEFSADDIHGRTIYINPDYLDRLIESESLTDADKKAALSLSLNESTVLSNQMTLTRLRPASEHASLYPSENWSEPLSHKVFHIKVNDDLTAIIKEIDPKQAKHMLAHPSPWEVRKLDGSARTSGIGKELIITHQGEEVALFSLERSQKGVIINATLCEKTMQHPERVPPIVSIIKNEVVHQQHSLFFTIDDASINQQPLDDVLADALVKMYSAKLKQSDDPLVENAQQHTMDLKSS